MDFKALLFNPGKGLTQTMRVMKLTAFILIAICMQVSADSLSQTVTLSAKDAPLEKVIKTIRKQTGYSFFYNADWLEKAKTVTLQVKDMAIGEALGMVFRDQPVSFSIINNTIVLKLKALREVGSMGTGQANAALDAIDVSGRVVNEKGEAMEGVTVTVKGSKKATSTNNKGEFSVSASTGSTLVFSYVGYASKELAVGNQSNYTVTLQVQSSALNDVVVIGYGTRLKKDVTGAVSTIDASAIGKSTSLSPELAMQGQMAGVNVTSAGGNPTARPTVRIRGVTSFNNADPLYVIDGVPFYEGGAGAVVDPTNDPTRRGPVNIYTIINPNDIESISVLKDASASAIYGVSAANGVILITTKQGRRGRVRVDFDGQYGSQKIPKTFDVLNTQQYVKFYTDIYNANPDKTSGGALVPIEQAEFFGPLWNPSNPNYIGNRPTYDWQDAVINHDSKIKNYNIRASGASENTSYNFSVGYSNNDGPFVGYNAERYSISTNVTSKIGKYFEAGINLRGVQTRTLNPDANINLDVYRAAPWQAIYDPAGPGGYAPLWQLTAPLTPTQFDKTSLYAHQYVAYSNVLGQLATSDNKSQNQTGIGSGYLLVQPIVGLKIKGSVSAQQTTITNNGWRDFDNWWFGENPESPFTPVKTPIAGTRPGYISMGNSVATNIMKALNVDYAKTFRGHSLNITLDASQQQYKWTTNGGSSTILTSDPTLRYFSPGPNNNGAYYEGRGAWALIGYLGRVSYNYQSKYYIDGVIRRDGSSRFAPGRQWGTFPSGSIAWRISQEDFMKSLPFLNDLKLRAGYGLLGNENTTAGWKYLSVAGATVPSYSTGNPSTNNLGISFNTFPNEPLTWEKVHAANIGFDAILLNNSVTLTVDYYNKRTKGIIQSVSLAPTTGFSGTADLNIAEVLNRGFEFQAAYNKRFGEFGVSFTGNFTTVHNEVLSLLNNNALRSAGLEVGKPIGFIYGYKIGGIFQNEAEVTKYNQSVSDPGSLEQKPGDYYFQNLYGAPTPGSTNRNFTKDSLINANDQDYLGKTIPGYYYGFTATAEFKGFDLALFFQGVGDVQRVNTVLAGGEGMNGYGRNAFTTVLNAWTPSNTTTKLPRAVYADPNQNLRFSDRFVESGAYLRLQNIQLGYNVPAGLINRTKGAIQNLRLYVSGINLFTITSYSGLDPENDLYPTTRQYLFGVKASF
jgi:TonB-linked SusC/RagA family outer membrane protein